MKFSDALWQQIAPIYQTIVDHPFNRELAEGVLDWGRFIFYLEQDAYYLVRFSRALALIAGRASSAEMTRCFLNFALGALVDERELHARFLSSIDCGRVKPSPICMAYTDYLMAVASTAPLEEGVAALLPCFWIYREVGRDLSKRTQANNPYMSWIESYSSEAFSEGTDQAIEILDEIAREASEEERIRMQKAFECSALFELRFFEGAKRPDAVEDCGKEDGDPHHFDHWRRALANEVDKESTEDRLKDRQLARQRDGEADARLVP